MPRKMRFSPNGATSIDLYAYEIAQASRHAGEMTVFAERTDRPFADVRARFWEPGARTPERARMIGESAPRLAIVHQHLPTAVGLARRLKGIPVALIRHNFVKAPRGSLSRWRRQQQFRKLAALAFVSECCREAFRGDFPEVVLPLFVTPNGIDNAAWRPAPAKRRRIVFTGRLAPEKGVLEAVRALGEVLPRHPGWDAVLALVTEPRSDGYGRAVEAAIAKADSPIAVLENLTHAEVRAIVSEAAIALAPTQTVEPFGRVAIEALASGAALIATRRGGFVEVVGEAGVLIDPPSADKIAEALHNLVADAAGRARLSALGPDRVAGRYDLPSAAAAFDGMVDRLLGIGSDAARQAT